MRIAYLIHWNEGPDSGVFKKVVGQMTEWIHLGHEVTLFLFTHRQENEWKDSLENIGTVIQIYENGIKRFDSFRKLIDQVSRWKPDVVYHRFDLYYPGLPKLMKKLPFVLEINTNDLSEMQLGGKPRYWYHLATRSRVLKAASGFVFVSAEMADEPHFYKYVQDKIVIGNGYALNDITPSPSAGEGEVRAIFIGTAGQSWHGVDHISALAKVRPSWVFDIIGPMPAELTGPVPENMIFHGSLSKREYEPLMRRADVAFGSLGLYRKKMNEASPLKVREYLAYRIPVIIGYKDTDFPNPVPFILELPNEPDNTIRCLKEIDAFVQFWKGNGVAREDISHLDNKVKEATRLNYLDRIRKKGAKH